MRARTMTTLLGQSAMATTTFTGTTYSGVSRRERHETRRASDEIRKEFSRRLPATILSFQRYIFNSQTQTSTRDPVAQRLRVPIQVKLTIARFEASKQVWRSRCCGIVLCFPDEGSGFEPLCTPDGRGP